MNMEQAMYYELIVRRANGNGGRYCVAGADADIFRYMERKWSCGFDGKYIFSEFERGMSLGIVVAFLMDSIERLIKSGKYSIDAVKELESVQSSLRHPSLEVVDSSIKHICEILKPL